MKIKVRMIAALLFAVMLLITLAQAAPGKSHAAVAMSITEADPEAASSLLANMLSASAENNTAETTFTEPDPDEIVRVIVLLDDAPLVEKGITDPTAANARKGMSSAKTAQADLKKRIEKEVFDGKELETVYSYSFVLNGFSMDVPYGMIEKIENVQGVGSVTQAFKITPLETVEDYDYSFEPTSEVADEDRENPTKYRGEHTAVAILDTGIEYSHPVFQTAVPNPLFTKNDIAAKINTLDLNAERSSDFSLDKVYVSSKIPYTFDYGDMDTDATYLASDPHGIHVAGIVAGDDTVSGVHPNMNSAVPDAQILPIKIFDKNHMATLDMLAAAIEDCALLGVDSINMSFAIVEAFSSMTSLDPFSTACQNAIDSGVNVVAACGNSFNSSMMNKIGGKTFTFNPDNSIVAAPASLINILSVAAGKGSAKRVIAEFSSQGPTPDLVLCPEVAAFGENVYSSYRDNGYTTLSGTSMASPYVAGSIAGIRQYIREKINLNSLPTPMSIQDLAKSLMICTAIPGTSTRNNNQLASPRKQGAGHMNMVAATTTPAYITIGSNPRPVIDQIDDPERTGVYELEFRVNNMTKNALHYNVEVITMTEEVVQYAGPDGGRSDYMMGFDRTLDPEVTVSGVQNGALSVSGSDYKDVKVTLNLSQEDRTFLDRYYTNGGYVEGFIRLLPVDPSGVALTVPFLCFYGDWTVAPMIDVGYYYNDLNDEVNWRSAMTNAVYTSYGRESIYLGDNPLHPGEVPYVLEHNAISPNNDGYNDRVESVQVALLRNARRAGYKIWNDDGVYWTREKEYVPKSYTNQNTREIQHLGIQLAFLPWRGSGLENNTTVYITTYAEMDFERHAINNANSEWTVPVTIDTEAPTLVSAKLTKEGSKTFVTLVVLDNQFIADITIADRDFQDGIESFAISETERGVQKMYKFDVTDAGQEFGIMLTDYALNSSAYVVTSSGYTNPDVTPDPGLELPVGEFLPGDANLDGRLTAGDATMILRHSVDMAPLTGKNLEAADANLDGKVNAGDATMVLRKVVGLA